MEPASRALTFRDWAGGIMGKALVIIAPKLESSLQDLSVLFCRHLLPVGEDIFILFGVPSAIPSACRFVLTVAFMPEWILFWFKLFQKYFLSF